MFPDVAENDARADVDICHKCYGNDARTDVDICHKYCGLKLQSGEEQNSRPAPLDKRVKRSHQVG